MEEKLEDSVTKTEAADVSAADETKKKIDWMEWMVQDLLYRVSKLEDENRKLREDFNDTVQDRDYRIRDIDNRCYGIEAKLSDYSKYVLEMSNEYVEKYTHMTLSTD
jgi:uncharacterized coiled-coil DUF342 family protein